jgi:hypothetical protein
MEAGAVNTNAEKGLTLRGKTGTICPMGSSTVERASRLDGCFVLEAGPPR